jgi:iron complex outermembrane receptor protein
MLQNSSTNIIDALSKVPGVSQITTGAGISKPVIRGLGYNRVVVVSDGIRQEGQQWGDEHGIELDENRVNHVEILKGPASLAYGSDAMAGVIDMISDPTLAEGAMEGNFSSNYQTNNGLIDYSADFAGNKKGLIWDYRFSNKLAHAYQNKYDGYVYNSGFREYASNATIGLNRSWGFSHLNLSLYNLEPGIVEGERDSLTGKFLKTTFGTHDDPMTQMAGNSDFHSYQPGVPFQKVSHYKAVWNNNIYFGQGNLEATLGFQQNQRKEFENPDHYGLYFLLNTLNYNFKFNFPKVDNWKIVAGLNGMWQQSLNKGTEFLVPAYHLFDYGLFTILSKKSGNFDFSGGIRFDQRNETADALYENAAGEIVSPNTAGATKRFSAFQRTFIGVSGSLGSAWQITPLVFSKLNFSRGFRAPDIAELGSNGVHEGTQHYEIGNSELKPESSLQIDYAIGLNSTHVSTELNLFVNNIHHFIFSNRADSSVYSGPQFNNVPVFRFTQGKATFYGGEFELDIHPHPLDWIHFENNFSYVLGKLAGQPDSMRYLPFIPAPRWISDIKIEFRKVGRFLSNSYLKFGIQKTWAQNHVYSAFNTETATPGYTLLDMGAGTDILNQRRKTLFSLYISAENLADIAFQSHLSRLKYVGMNHATGRSGIFNMGRNISFKMVIPIDFSDEKQTN